MNTTDQVLLIVLTSLLGVFFLLCIIAIVIVIKLLNGARKVVAKADGVVESVEEAAEAFGKAQGKMAIFKLMKNIIKLSKKGK